MDFQIRRLTPDLTDDYLYYFDNVAFKDHEEWSYCYCLESHLKQEENDAITDKSWRREKAKELIAEGVMQGYLVYDGDAVVGWCNAGDKTGYEPIMANSEFETQKADKGKILVVYCFEIEAASRGKGITHLLMDRIARDAEEEGYSYIEGYPFTDVNFEYQYRGPISLYEKHGFRKIAEKGWFCIMQKEL